MGLGALQIIILAPTKLSVNMYILCAKLLARHIHNFGKIAKNKDLWNESICHPDVIQKLHDIFIEGEDKGNIKAHSAKARYCSLVKSVKENGLKIPQITQLASLNY